MVSYKITIGEKTFEVKLGEIRDGEAQVTVGGKPYLVKFEKNFGRLDLGAAVNPAVAKPSSGPVKQVACGEGTPIRAPIPGVVLEVKVKVGDPVMVDQPLLVVEAMKMENHITANANGTVKEIRVQKGTSVATGDILMVIG